MVRTNKDDESNIEEIDPRLEYEKRFIRTIVTGFISVVIVIFLLIFFFGSFYTVGAGERAIVLTFQKPSEDIKGAGLHFKFPIIQSVVKMNIRTQTISFDNKQGTGDNSEYSSLFSASSDLQDVQTAIVVNYHISEKDVLQIYKQYGDSDSFQKNILEPLVRDSVKSVSATYTAEDLVKKRSEYNDKISKVLMDRFNEKSAIFEKVNIVNFQFSSEFTKAIERKVTAEQDALAQKNKLEQIKYEAQQRVEQANGEARAIEIQVNAINKQGGQAYVELQKIQKWDGKLPLITGSGAVPFIDINNLNNKTV